MKKGTAIHWFRQDLRLSDNPALDSAAQYETLIPIYILDEVIAENLKWVQQVNGGCINL